MHNIRLHIGFEECSNPLIANDYGQIAEQHKANYPNVNTRHRGICLIVNVIKIIKNSETIF
jgi:hypothetical protein